jgi:hypothetical protein
MPMLPTSYRANPEKMSDAPIDGGCRPMTSSIKVPTSNTGWELRSLEYIHEVSVCVEKR